MPIYEYECSKCGIKTELLQKITEKPAIIICPTKGCNSRLNKIISTGGFVLKGEGFYATSLGVQND